MTSYGSYGRVVAICVVIGIALALIKGAMTQSDYVATVKLELDVKKDRDSKRRSSLSLEELGKEALRLTESDAVVSEVVKRLGWPENRSSEVKEAMDVVQKIENSVILDFTFTLPDQEIVAEVADVYAEVFLQKFEEHFAQTYGASDEYLVKKVREIGKDLSMVRDRIIRLKKNNDAVRSSRLNPAYSRWETKVEVTRKIVSGKRTKLTALKKEKAGKSESVLSKEMLAQNSTITDLKKDLFQNEVELASMMRTMTSRHPDVKKTRARIENLRSELEIAISNVLDSWENELVRELAEADGAIHKWEKEIPPKTIWQRSGMSEEEEEQVAFLREDAALHKKMLAYYTEKLDDRSADSPIDHQLSFNILAKSHKPTHGRSDEIFTRGLRGGTYGILMSFAVIAVLGGKSRGLVPLSRKTG